MSKLNKTAVSHPSFIMKVLKAIRTAQKKGFAVIRNKRGVATALVKKANNGRYVVLDSSGSVVNSALVDVMSSIRNKDHVSNLALRRLITTPLTLKQAA